MEDSEDLEWMLQQQGGELGVFFSFHFLESQANIQPFIFMVTEFFTFYKR